MEHKKHSELKWLILFSFSILIGVNQLLWLTFAPIVITTQNFLNISEFKANLLTLIFPAIYVLFSIHSGKLIDQKGYKKVVTFAGLAMLIGSGLRFLGLSNYWIVLTGQFLIAISQPYMLNAINKIIADWFEPKEIYSATGISIGILFLGTLIGAFIPAPLIKHLHFEGMLLVNFFITLISFLFFISVIKEKNVSKSLDSLSFQSILYMLRNKRLWVIASLVFVSFGYFNGITNWIAPILELRNIDEIKAGIVTSIFILGGIFGAILVPILSDKIQKRQIFIIVAIISSIIFVYPLLNVLNFNFMLIISFILGFTLLAGYPILIAATEQIVDQKDAGKSVAFLELMGNLGGVFVVLMMEIVKNFMGSWKFSVYVLIGIMLLAIPLSFILKDKD